MHLDEPVIASLGIGQRAAHLILPQGLVRVNGLFLPAISPIDTLSPTKELPTFESSQLAQTLLALHQLGVAYEALPASAAKLQNQHLLECFAVVLGAINTDVAYRGVAELVKVVAMHGGVEFLLASEDKEVVVLGVICIPEKEILEPQSASSVFEVEPFELKLAGVGDFHGEFGCWSFSK
ncbi:hypothetical protein NUU61_006210 [Penicillium alfredii]|uniref:Uncharacterized protein n=1 Tax=Penicillium alfredii TaxID=1506179 RepID=A0A9W9F0I0_9EURO|nr:uncharacterized protein NUU61_006210 [Penicillium alfredii]KAJ5091340.1 hypothetical protein NUU61_006210 [Penicillium alfredii]